MYRILVTMTTRVAPVIGAGAMTSTSLDVYAVQSAHRDGSPNRVSEITFHTDGTYHASPVRRLANDSVGAIVGDYQITPEQMTELATRVAGSDYGRGLAARCDYAASIPLGHVIDPLDTHARADLFNYPPTGALRSALTRYVVRVHEPYMPGQGPRAMYSETVFASRPEAEAFIAAMAGRGDTRYAHIL